MYATLHYTGSAVTQEVFNDIIAVLTGETLESNLSATLDQTNSFINVTSSAAGWSVHDTVASDDVVIRAPVSDDPSQFKYLRFRINASTYIYWEAYMDWDNVAHSGTLINRRLANTTTSLSTTFSSTNSPVIYWYDGTNESTVFLSASPKHFAATFAHQNMTEIGKITMLSEHTRSSPWDTVANGYPPFVLTTSSIYSNSLAGSSSQYKLWFFKPLYPKDGLTDYSHAVSNDYYACNCYIATPLGAPGDSSSSTVDQDIDIPSHVLDSSKAAVPVIVPFGVHRGQFGFLGGELSSQCGIYLMTAIANQNDIVTVGPNNYRVWRVPGSQTGPSPSLATQMSFVVLDG